MFKSKGKATLKLRCYDSLVILDDIVNFPLILLCLWSWIQGIEMDFWVFTKTWSLVENIQISKLCGKWLSLPLLKIHFTRKEPIFLHIGWSVLGQLEILLSGCLHGHDFFLMGECSKGLIKVSYEKVESKFSSSIPSASTPSFTH